MHYIILATHNSNRNFDKYNKANPSYQLKYVEDTKNPLGYAKTNAKEQLLNKLKEVVALEETPQLITLVTDFNLGYSSIDISPIPQMIEAISLDEDLIQVRFVNTEFEIDRAKTEGFIPVRLVLVGSGGSAPKSDETYPDCIPMTTDDKANYTYKGWNNHLTCMKELFVLNNPKPLKRSTSGNESIHLKSPADLPGLKRATSEKPVQHSIDENACETAAGETSLPTASGLQKSHHVFSFSGVSSSSIATTASLESAQSARSPSSHNLQSPSTISRLESLGLDSYNSDNLVVSMGLFSPQNTQELTRSDSVSGSINLLAQEPDQQQKASDDALGEQLNQLSLKRY